MTLPLNIRVNVRASFPALVNPSGFLTLTKANGVWTFGANFELLLALPGLLTSNALIPVQDPGSGAFYTYAVSNLVALVTGVGAAVPNRIITAAGAVAALPADGDILIKKTVPAATTVNLVAAANATRPVSVKDFAGNAFTNNITIVPNGAETIDGLASVSISSDWGAKTFYPVSGTGYYLK